MKALRAIRSWIIYVGCWASSFCSEIIHRAAPYAPYVLAICDQLELEPHTFVSMSVDNGLRLRPISGLASSQGIAIDLVGDRVTLTSQYLGLIELSWREHRALRAAVNNWIDLVDIRAVAPFLNKV